MGTDRTERPGAAIPILCLLVIVGMIVGTLVGFHLTNQYWQTVAVDAGHATWFVEDHQKKWRWLQPCNFEAGTPAPKTEGE